MKKAKYITAKRRQRGFTMIELMITITLVAILASIAVPSMRTYVLNNRLNSASNELLRTLQIARSEAVKRQHNVVICASANPQAATADVACTTETPTGWILFEDFSTDTAVTNSDWERDSSESLIEVHTFDSSKVKILADGSKRVAYLATGFGSPAGTADADTQTPSTSIVICDDRGNVDSSGNPYDSDSTPDTALSVARGLIVTGTGRARTTKTLEDIDALLAETGGGC